MHHDSNRQTGRTTRMLRQALESALHGSNVFVMGHNSYYTASLAPKALALLKGFSGAVVTKPFSSNKQLFIHKRGAGVIEFQSAANESNVCLKTYPYCVRDHKEKCFVDHYVWEQAGWRPSHQKRNEPSDPKWSMGGYKRLWEALFPGSPTRIHNPFKASAKAVKIIADEMAKKPYMSSADGDMRDKCGGGPLPK